MPNKQTIIVADTSKRIQKTLVQSLEHLYIIKVITNEQEIFDAVAKKKKPSCIIIDLIHPKIDSFKITNLLKLNFITYHIPIIVLSNDISFEDILLAIDMGADDFMRKPCNELELSTRILMNIRRTERDLNANPLTKLPGNNAIVRTIQNRLTIPLAVLYIDIDNFKAYNDVYGFKKGDSVIKKTALLLSKKVKEYGTSDDFLGHIGGDDFIAISRPKKAISIAKAICESFDVLVPRFYNEHDRKTKKIVTQNRKGKTEEFPLMAISIAIVTNTQHQLVSTVQIGQIAAELKKYAKRTRTSNYVIDRRYE